MQITHSFLSITDVTKINHIGVAEFSAGSRQKWETGILVQIADDVFVEVK